MIIKEFNEFTWDMVRALPKANYLKENDIPFKIICKPNLSHLYDSYTDDIEERDIFQDINPKSTYSHTRPDFTTKEWIPPSLKKKWSGYLSFDKPTIVIQNKFAMEWNEGVFNYFSIEFLNILFNRFKNDYQFIYIRPDGGSKNYYKDKNRILEFKDYEFINNNHSDVITIKDLMQENSSLTFNHLQFAIHSTSNIHITTSGGTACIASYFGGDVFIFDSPNGYGAGRGIWKTDSWLKLLSGASIHGFNDYHSLYEKLEKEII